MKEAEELHFANRNDWRQWLRENHDTKKEVWLIYYKTNTGKVTISYEDSVEEALCFGWVDSIIKKIDDRKFARKFTPRTSKSTWSETNKKRAEKMIREGKMTEIGLTRIREAKDSGEWFKKPVSALYKKKLLIPSYLRDALAANKKALDNFSKMAESYQRNLVGWIESGKKEATRRKRLTEAITLLEQNKKLGMK
jgi:uncharacterized protein YdeI (YjbR/CyaY-like superfamily)